MKRFFVLWIPLFWAVNAANALAVGTPDAPSTDQAAISQLVNSYAQCVNNRDRKGFETLLLDKSVPFSSVSTGKAVADSNALKNYDGFDKAIFSGEYPYRQHVSDIKIDQVGPIAQVSLTFTVERLDGKSQVYTGWKILQLVKSNGVWKIASELWTFDAG